MIEAESDGDSVDLLLETQNLQNATIEIPDHVRQELDLLRREKAVLERELQLANREVNGTRLNLRMSVESVDSRQSYTNVSINNIDGLLGEFQDSDDLFPTWEKKSSYFKGHII